MERFSKEDIEALDKLISKMNSRVGIDHIDYKKEKVVLSYVYNKGTADEWKERNFLEVNTSCESVPCAIWEVVNATFKKACV